MIGDGDTTSRSDGVIDATHVQVVVGKDERDKEFEIQKLKQEVWAVEMCQMKVLMRKRLYKWKGPTSRSNCWNSWFYWWWRCIGKIAWMKMLLIMMGKLLWFRMHCVYINGSIPFWHIFSDVRDVADCVIWVCLLVLNVHMIEWFKWKTLQMMIFYDSNQSTKRNFVVGFLINFNILHFFVNRCRNTARSAI